MRAIEKLSPRMKVLLVIPAVMMAASAWPMEQADTYQRILQDMENRERFNYIEPTPDDFEVYTQAVGDKIMDVPSLQLGETIEALYINPTVGRMSLNLEAESGDVALHVNPRYVSGGTGSHLLVNTKLNGEWQERVIYPGYPFPANDVTTRVLLSITVKENGFLIAANGIEIAEFPYRPSLGYETVHSITWAPGSEDDQKAILESVKLTFK